MLSLKSCSWKAVSRSCFVLAAIAGFAWAPQAQAQLTNFANYNQKTDDPYTYTDHTTYATFATSPFLANFNYTNIVGLPADLSGTQDATVTLTSQTKTSINPVVGANVVGRSNDQYFDGTGLTTITQTLTITRTTPAAEGSGTRTNLLSVVFTGDLAGRNGGFTASFAGDTILGDTVQFTSDFLDFSNQTQDDLSIELTLLTALTQNADHNFNNFRGSGTGSFAGNPAPTVQGLPEPSTLALGCVGVLCAIGYGLRKRSRRAV